MPIYVFQSADGHVVEAPFPVSKAPRIGDIIDRGGVEFRRVPSFHLDVAGVDRKTHKYPYVSRSLPRGLEGCKTNTKSQPVIRSQQHEREVMARHGYDKD